MKTPIMSVALFTVAALPGAAGQFLYKSGAKRIADSRAGWETIAWSLEQAVRALSPSRSLAVHFECIQ
jgi:hypothetical protein